MTPPQISPTSAPPRAEVREGASSGTGAAGLVAPPDASPARSTEQTCTRCKRSGAVKVTVSVGDRRWRFCTFCVGRGDKTTTLAAVTCKHPYARAHHGGEGGNYTCIDCFEPVPAPAEVDPCSCGLCREAGRASLATVLTLGFYGAVLVAIATATGKLTPTPNGFALLCVGVLLIGCWRALRRPGPKLEKWPAGVEPLADCTWPDPDPEEELLAIDPKWGRS